MPFPATCGVWPAYYYIRQSEDDRSENPVVEAVHSDQCLRGEIFADGKRSDQVFTPFAQLAVPKVRFTQVVPCSQFEDLVRTLLRQSERAFGHFACFGQPHLFDVKLT